MDNHVKRLWPELHALEQALRALTSAPHTVTVASTRTDQHDIDRIHEGLLRKQRATGSLGLNE